MKKDKNDDRNQENEAPPSTNTVREYGLNIVINGCSVWLNPRSNPPTAESLFHAMFFDEELPRAPSHYRQQRWNKRRIQKRWSWKKGRDREIYEKRAEYLKNKWIEMKKDFVANDGKRLSKEYLEKNAHLRINLDDDIIEINNNNVTGDESAHESDEDAHCFSVLSNVDLNKSQHQNNRKTNSKNSRNVNEAKKLSKVEGKRKHIRRREKLIERIANGETLEDFVDHQKLNSIYNSAKSEKDNLLFGGTQSNNKNNKKSKSKTNKKCNNKKRMKLADFVKATKKTKKSGHKTAANKEKKCDNTVSLDDIQAEQLSDFEALTRRKRDEIHVKKVQKRNNEMNPLLRNSMRIRNYDHMVFRSRAMNEIYCGSSVFWCIPCCVEPSNAILVEAVFIEKLLMPHSSLSNLSGLFQLKKRLKSQFEENVAIEVLPIFERAYIDKQCVELLLIQFQDHIEGEDGYDNVQCALSLYHCWKQQTMAKNDKVRIEFIEKWFAKAYVLQHSHLWSDIALASNITVYDNNEKYIGDINKSAMHCRCSFKRVAYFPPFKNVSTAAHDMKCIDSCCCCMFYDDDDDDDHHLISNGDTLLWNGTKCRGTKHSNQQYKIQMNPFSHKYIVPLSSLQRISDVAAFDAHKHIVDDMSFVLYVQKFWNIEK